SRILRPLGSVIRGEPTRRRFRSGLPVEPAAARAVPAVSLAPNRDRLPCRVDADLAVVAVDLIEAVGVDVTGGTGRCVGDLHRRRPGGPTIAGASVPDVPCVGVVAVRGLHVPDTSVAVATG